MTGFSMMRLLDASSWFNGRVGRLSKTGVPGLPLNTITSGAILGGVLHRGNEVTLDVIIG